jgi:hypothetical protein
VELLGRVGLVSGTTRKGRREGWAVAEEGAGGGGEEERGIGEGESKRDWKRRRGGRERIGECVASGRREGEEEVDGWMSGGDEQRMGSEGEEDGRYMGVQGERITRDTAGSDGPKRSAST